MTVRVFLLDDHEIVRRGVRELLEANDDIEVVGEAGTAEEGMARIKAGYGANYERLVALKAKYDPTNLFRHNQNIPPTV